MSRSWSLPVLSLFLFMAGGAHAADKKPPAKAADPSGSWTWTFEAPNGESWNPVLKMKVDGDKVSGTVTTRRGEASLSEGKYKEGEISFVVVRERDGNKITTTYRGKLSTDAAGAERITGTIESNFGGEMRSRPWDAKREGAAVPAAATAPAPAPAKPAPKK